MIFSTKFFKYFREEFGNNCFDSVNNNTLQFENMDLNANILYK